MKFADWPQRNKGASRLRRNGRGGLFARLVIGGLLTAIDWRWVFVPRFR
jgi:hypothetical protein